MKRSTQHIHRVIEHIGDRCTGSSRSGGDNAFTSQGIFIIAAGLHALVALRLTGSVQACLLLRIIGESDNLKMVIAEEGGLAAVIEVATILNTLFGIHPVSLTGAPKQSTRSVTAGICMWLPGCSLHPW